MAKPRPVELLRGTSARCSETAIGLFTHGDQPTAAGGRSDGRPATAYLRGRRTMSRSGRRRAKRPAVAIRGTDAPPPRHLYGIVN